jgi:hypothetical protein
MVTNFKESNTADKGGPPWFSANMALLSGGPCVPLVGVSSGVGAHVLWAFLSFVSRR